MTPLSEQLIKRLKGILHANIDQLVICFPGYTRKQITMSLYSLRKTGKIKNIGKFGNPVYTPDRTYKPIVSLNKRVYQILTQEDITSADVVKYLPKVKPQRVYTAINALVVRGTIKVVGHNSSERKIYGTGDEVVDIRLVTHKDRKLAMLNRMIPRMSGVDKDLLIGVIYDLSR